MSIATPAATSSFLIRLRAPVSTTIGKRPAASGTVKASAASLSGTRTWVSCTTSVPGGGGTPAGCSGAAAGGTC